MIESTTAIRTASETELQREHDLELARAAAQGDPHARRTVVERLLDRVRTVAAYLANGDDDAEDCAQLALIEILQSVHSFRGESSLETWADRVVVRTTLRELRRSWWRRGLRPFEPEAEAAEPRMGEMGEEELTRRRMRARLVALFRELPPRRRLPVVLRVVFGHGIDEIATMTGARPNTVRNRLRTGRAELRQRIRKDTLFKEWLKEMDRAKAR